MQRRNRNMGAMGDRLKQLGDPLPELVVNNANRDLDEIDRFIKEDLNRDRIPVHKQSTLWLKDELGRNA